MSIPKRKRLHSWSLGIDRLFHRTLYWASVHLSKLGTNLFQFRKRGPLCIYVSSAIWQLRPFDEILSKWPPHIQSQRSRLFVVTYVKSQESCGWKLQFIADRGTYSERDIQKHILVYIKNIFSVFSMNIISLNCDQMLSYRRRYIIPMINPFVADTEICRANYVKCWLTMPWISTIILISIF